MLARRPMLLFALSLMAGSVAMRWWPGLAAWWPWLALIAAGRLAWVLALPPRRQPPPPALAVDSAIPAAYQPHIMARPGFFARRGLNRVMIAACLLFCIVGGWRQWHWQQSRQAIALPVADFFAAEFTALAPSSEYPAASGRWRVPALVTAVDGQAVTPFRVRLIGPAKIVFRRGDTISARVRRGSRFLPGYPGAFDYRLWLEREGLVTQLSIPYSAANAVVVTPNHAPSIYSMVRRALDGIRGRAITATLARGGQYGGMLAAMLYGYRAEVPDEVRDAFRRVGIGHVLAISGLHVGLIVGLLWWLSGWLGWPGRYRALACLVLAIAYLGLAGGMVAATRATIMAVIHLLGIAWGRRSDMLNSLGAAAFLIILANPSTPLDVSFQLSFTAVVFIFIALRRQPYRDRPRRRAPTGGWSRTRRRMLGEVFSLAKLSVSTWLGLFPIVATIFHQINLAGLPINILVIPLMSLVLAGGLLLPWLAWIPGAAPVLLLPSRLLTGLALWVDGFSWSSLTCHAPGRLWVVLFYLFFSLFALTGLLRDRHSRRRWLAAAAVPLLLTFIALAASTLVSAPPPSGGRISHLPGWNRGTIIAEAADGGIALIGDVTRGGMEQAGWLHYQRRSGPVSVLATGRTRKNDLEGLSHHYPVSHFTAIRITDRAEATTWPAWQPVPEAPGIEYAVSRDRRGVLVWLAVRSGGKSVVVAPELALRQLTWRLEHRTPGYNADVFSLAFKDRGLQSADLPALPRWGGVGRWPAETPLPPGWFARDAVGALVLEGDGELVGYDGDGWVRFDAAGSGSAPPSSHRAGR